jgi:prefoldin alpha subunit
MNEELILQASMLERQAEEISQRLQNVENELEELKRFKDSLVALFKSENKTMLSSLGKGVSIRTERIEDDLYVEVGMGIVVKKKPKEVEEEVTENIKKLSEARAILIERFESITNTLQSYFREFEKSQSAAQNSDKCEGCDGNCACEEHACKNHKH